MNRTHLEFLASEQWADALRTDLLPWLEGLGDLGDEVLEIGPGPGLTTDLLRARVAAVTAVEIDAELARDLAARLAGTNVRVVAGDATAIALPAGHFSAATCFSMLHHMPTPTAQDALFAVLAAALAPGALLAGVDSIDSPAIRSGHIDDVFVPVSPETLGERLGAVGFCDVAVAQHGEYQFRFHARKSAVAPVAAGC